MFVRRLRVGCFTTCQRYARQRVYPAVRVIRLREKSLLSIILTFVFSVVGFASHTAAIADGSVLFAAIAAFIYVFPLLIDAVEDLSAIYVHNMIQYRINVLSIIIGIVYLVAILAYLAFQTQISPPAFVDMDDFKYILAVLPAVFIVSKLYELRIALRQQKNVALAYFRD